MHSLLVHGAKGAMGQVLMDMLTGMDHIHAIGLDPRADMANKPWDFLEEIDLIIDFSHFSQVDRLIDQAMAYQVPLVIATTALSQNTLDKLEEASKTIPIFLSDNYALGLQVLIHLAQEAIQRLEDFDVEIIEAHHRYKQDAPSGTAKMILQGLQEKQALKPVFERQAKRQAGEVGIHAIRAGTITGSHQVLFAGQDETISLHHQAYSKEIFAKGAYQAGRFLLLKEPGLYSMKDLLERI